MTGIELSSTTFDDHTAIPRRYSGEGENVSPPLTWSAAPEGTAELVLLCEDPDAPGPPLAGHRHRSGGHRGREGQKPRGGRPWPNGLGRVGWGGPMPPPGHGPHRYFFRLYALSEPLNLHDRPTVDTVHRAVKAKELAVGTLVGTYQR